MVSLKMTNALTHMHVHSAILNGEIILKFPGQKKWVFGFANRDKVL